MISEKNLTAEINKTFSSLGLRTHVVSNLRRAAGIKPLQGNRNEVKGEQSNWSRLFKQLDNIELLLQHLEF